MSAEKNSVPHAIGREVGQSFAQRPLAPEVLQEMIDRHERRAEELAALIPMVSKLEGPAEAAMYQILLNQRT